MTIFLKFFPVIHIKFIQTGRRGMVVILYTLCIAFCWCVCLILLSQIIQHLASTMELETVEPLLEIIRDNFDPTTSIDQWIDVFKVNMKKIFLHERFFWFLIILLQYWFTVFTRLNILKLNSYAFTCGTSICKSLRARNRNKKTLCSTHLGIQFYLVVFVTFGWGIT